MADSLRSGCSLRDSPEAPPDSIGGYLCPDRSVYRSGPCSSGVPPGVASIAGTQQLALLSSILAVRPGVAGHVDSVRIVWQVLVSHFSSG